MKKRKHLVIFLTVLLITTIILGFIYGINNTYDLSEYIKSLSKHNNLFFSHGLVLTIFLFSTISLLGIFFESVLIGFEGMSLGYVLALFYSNYKLKGLIYGLITVLINKGFFLIVLCYLFVVSYIYIKKSVLNIIGNNKDYLIVVIKPLLQKYFIVIIGVIIYDLLIYFFGNDLLNYLTYLIK